jgi:hypothetical protein
VHRHVALIAPGPGELQAGLVHTGPGALVAEGVEPVAGGDAEAVAGGQVPGAADPVAVEERVRAALPLAEAGRVHGVPGRIVQQAGAVAVGVVDPVQLRPQAGAGAVVLRLVPLLVGPHAQDAPQLAAAVPIIAVERDPLARVPVLQVRWVAVGVLSGCQGKAWLHATHGARGATRIYQTWQKALLSYAQLWEAAPPAVPPRTQLYRT